MPPPIALVTRLSANEEEAWAEALRTSLPGESILRVHDMTLGQRTRCDIAIVANPDPADIALLPHCRWIQSVWAGVERLVAELGARAVPIVRLVDSQLAGKMAEAVLACTLYLFRDMPVYVRQQRARIWKQRPYRRAQEVAVGILGLGALGQAAAARLRDAGFRVAAGAASRNPSPASRAIRATAGWKPCWPVRTSSSACCRSPTGHGGFSTPPGSSGCAKAHR